MFDFSKLLGVIVSTIILLIIFTQYEPNSFESKTKIFGYPLISITDEKAEGIIAIGQQAVGIISISQIGAGLIALNQIGAGFLFGFGMINFGTIGVGLMGLGLFLYIGVIGFAYKGIPFGIRNKDFFVNFKNDMQDFKLFSTDWINKKWFIKNWKEFSISSAGFILILIIFSLLYFKNYTLIAKGCQNDYGDFPHLLTLGTAVRGRTSSHSNILQSGSCIGSGEAPDVVYYFNIDKRAAVTFESETDYDGALVLSTNYNWGKTAELACSDDAGDSKHSKLNYIIEPGLYYLIMTGYSDHRGSYKIKTTFQYLEDLSTNCSEAPVLIPGVKTKGTTKNLFNYFQPVCALGSNSPDKVYKIQINKKSIVTVKSYTQSFDGVLYLRSDCANVATELACNDDYMNASQSMINSFLDPGTYYVIIDGYSNNSSGDFELELSVTETDFPDNTINLNLCYDGDNCCSLGWDSYGKNQDYNAAGYYNTGCNTYNSGISCYNLGVMVYNNNNNIDGALYYLTKGCNSPDIFYGACAAGAVLLHKKGNTEDAIKMFDSQQVNIVNFNEGETKMWVSIWLKLNKLPKHELYREEGEKLLNELCSDGDNGSCRILPNLLKLYENP